MCRSRADGQVEHFRLAIGSPSEIHTSVIFTTIAIDWQLHSTEICDLLTHLSAHYRFCTCALWYDFTHAFELGRLFASECCVVDDIRSIYTSHWVILLPNNSNNGTTTFRFPQQLDRTMECVTWPVPIVTNSVVSMTNENDEQIFSMIISSRHLIGRGLLNLETFLRRIGTMAKKKESEAHVRTISRNSDFWFFSFLTKVRCRSRFRVGIHRKCYQFMNCLLNRIWSITFTRILRRKNWRNFVWIFAVELSGISVYITSVSAIGRRQLYTPRVMEDNSHAISWWWELLFFFLRRINGNEWCRFARYESRIRTSASRTRIVCSTSENVFEEMALMTMST